MFRRDPAFDGVALERDVFLCEGQRQARCDADLFAYHVDAGDHLGHRMFDLQAGIHLDKIELAILEQELDRSGIGIADTAHGIGGDLADLFALLVVQGRGAGFFEYFLMAALQRTVALTHMHGAALTVGKNLDLNMARFFEELFHVNGIVAEACLGLGSGHRVGRFDLVGVPHDLHATTATAARGLDQDRVADLIGGAARLAFRLDGTGRPGHNRHTIFRDRLFRGDLVAHQGDMLGAWPDKGEAMLFEDRCETGLFRQETISGMHRVRPRDGGCRHDGRNIKIAFLCIRRAQTDAFIRETDMHGIGIRGRMDRDRRDAHLLASAMDAKGDFAAICDQNFFEHFLCRSGP